MSGAFRLFTALFLLFAAAGIVAAPLPLHAQTPPASSASPPPDAAPQPTAEPPARPKSPEIAPDVLEPVGKLTNAIEQAEKSIQQLDAVEGDLRRLRNQAEEILAQSTSTAEDLRPRLADVQALIEKLGPPPAKDQPAEAPAVAAERARLNALAAELDGAIKTTELTWARARQLIERITVMRHSLFTKNLVERLHSPLLPQVWKDLGAQLPNLARRVSANWQDWTYWAGKRGGELAALIASTVVLFGALFWGTRALIARRRRRLETDAAPTFFERGMSIAWVAPLRALPAVAAATLLYAGLETLDLLYAPWAKAFGGVFTAVIEFSIMTAIIGAVLSPRAPQWRIVPLDDVSAHSLARILYAITAVYAVDGALAELGRAFLAPLTLTVVQSFAASLLFAGLLLAATLTPFNAQIARDAPPEQDVAPVVLHETPPRLRPLWLKLPLCGFALAIAAAAALGFIALARFMAQQVLLTGMVVAVVWLLYLAIRALTRLPHTRNYPVTEVLEVRFGLDEDRRRQLARLTETALTFALLICAIPVLMLQWGFSGSDIRDWFKALLFGMEIGSFKISLARILIGIVLFIALLFTTRLFQHWLRDKALKETKLDSGIIDSIDTVVGYACIAISALIAVSYAGFDITSLAIVAGALSVGIGFGLQSIVNNFVSGLILLIERPIKVGDRIVVGTEQGNVRRISVRATEVETFDKASLIIPNSELITSKVLNWTHRNKMGAVNVKVSTSYNADPEAVLKILVDCATAHAEVLTTPAPGASLENFGDSALMYNLRITLADVDRAGNVQSDLRVAILKAFRAAGIEIPYHTVDVNMRDLDTVKRYLVRMMEERAAQKAAAAAQTVDGEKAT